MPSALGPVDTEHNKAKDFGRVFCSTLTHFRDPDGRSWGDCAKYLDQTEPAQPQREFATPYRWLFVSGFGDDCLNDVRAFSSSIAHLKSAHQITVEYFSVAPYGASEENGRSIARHIEDGWATDAAHKYVLVGYDKGAADLLDALRALNLPATKVAALVTIAGTVGGTWVPESYRALKGPAQLWMASGCPSNVSDGLQNLTRDVRQRFLRENPMPVPGYSIVASSPLGDTSTVFRESWKVLAGYAIEQDGLMVGWEALLPGAKYLGMAHADHWAIALPFSELPQPPKGIDHNRYPRDALFEAIVRYVSTDVAASEAKPGT